MDEKPKVSMGLRAAYVVLFSILVYPLSMGPLIWLDSHNLISDSALVSLSAIYFPLGYLVEAEVPVVAPLLEFYAEFWGSI